MITYNSQRFAENLISPQRNTQSTEIFFRFPEFVLICSDMLTEDSFLAHRSGFGDLGEKEILPLCPPWTLW